MSQVSPEVARINATLLDIRRMIDAAPAQVVEEDVETFLSRRFGADPIPLRDAAAEHVAFEILPPVAPLVPYRPAPQRPIPPGLSDERHNPQPAAPRLTLRLVVEGWWQWVLWKLQAPRIPPAAERVAAAAPIVAAPAVDPAPAAPEPAPAKAADPAVAAPVAAPFPAQPSVCPDDIAARAVDRLLDGDALQERLNEMIREELQGEMGSRFSSNIRAVIRREVATAMDDRL